MDKVQNKTVDGRFSELNLNATEYEVQHDSGVLEILKAKPLSEDYFPDQFKGKHATEYKFYGRPTISWSLDCNTTRPNLIDILTAGKHHTTSSAITLGLIVFLSFSTLIFGLLFLCFGCMRINKGLHNGVVVLTVGAIV